MTPAHIDEPPTTAELENADESEINHTRPILLVLSSLIKHLSGSAQLWAPKLSN